MATKDFKIKQKTSTGFDILYPETRAEQVIINPTTGDTLATHLDDSMPHKFTKAGTTYKYGFSVNDALDGLTFNYEEVV